MIFLALKHLVSRRRQSIFTLIGIFFGTAAYVIISGFFLGFREYLTDQLVSNDAHIKVTKNDEKTDTESIIEVLMRNNEHLAWIRQPNPRINASEIQNPLGWVEKIKSSPEVTAVGFQYSVTALISKAGISQSASLIGTEPDQQVKITNIETKMIKGQFKDLKRGLDLVVLGETLANDMGVTLDDIVTVSSATGLSFPMKVVGIYSLGNRHSERGTVYTSLSTAQKLGAQNGQINQISIKTKDYYKAASIADDWKSFSKDKVESWDQANASFLSIFQTQDIMRYSTITILLLVAGFGIYNILSMVVMQKRRDIAILRSMGFDAEDILVLFLLQGSILGTLGSFLGVFVGYFICGYLETLTMGGPAGGTHMHIAYDYDIYVKAVVLGIGASMIAAYLPSRSASLMTPIDIIRAGAE